MLIARLREEGIITPQNETDWLGSDRKTERLRIDRFKPEGAETLRQAITGAFVQNKTVPAKSSAHLRDLYERIAPVAMELDTWEAPKADDYNVTPAFRLASKEAWRVVGFYDADLHAYYGDTTMFDDNTAEQVIETPLEIFEAPLVAAALLWLRRYTRGSRVKGARRWFDYWRSIPEDIRDPGANVMFPSEPPDPAELREQVFGLASTDEIANVGVLEYLAGATRRGNPTSLRKAMMDDKNNDQFKVYRAGTKEEHDRARAKLKRLVDKLDNRTEAEWKRFQPDIPQLTATELMEQGEP